MDHSFYSAVPEKFFLDSMVVSHLNNHFQENKIKYFKTSFKVLTGATSKIPCDVAEQINESVKLMHDMVHGRYVISEIGLESVREKHIRGVYGKCPRLYCEEHALLPLGLNDVPGKSHTKCFCPKCRDVYLTPSHVEVDSIVFGTSLPHLFLQQYPDLCPVKPDKIYVPKIFGFRIHPSSPVLCKYEERNIESEEISK
jgi:casein kinase II subunit beta